MERESESERCERGNEGKVYEGKERVSKRKKRKRGEKKRPEARLLNQQCIPQIWRHNDE